MTSQYISKLVNKSSRGRIKYGWWSSTWQSKTSPIIIGGCGRSGTSLLKSLLDTHSNICIGPETGLFCGVQDIEEISNSIEIDMKVLKSYYMHSSCLGEFIEGVCGEAINNKKKIRWGEKSPCNVNSINYIFKFFPKAKFIHIIRDGRDVVCSLRDHPKWKWKNGELVPTNIINPWENCLKRWVNDTKAGIQWRHDNRYMEIKYEDLVMDTKPILNEILNWIGEPWESNILDVFYKKSLKGHDNINPGLKKPLYTKVIGRWKEDLPLEVRKMFRSEANSLLVEMDYIKDDSWDR